MKTKTVFLLVAVLITAVSSFAQVTVSNTAKKMCFIQLRNGKADQMVAPGASLSDPNYKLVNGNAEISIKVMEGNIKPIGCFSLPVTNGQAVITDEILSKSGAKTFAELSPDASVTTPLPSAALTDVVVKGKTRLMAMTNLAGSSFVVLDSPFAGVCLGDKQRSRERYNVSPGILKCAILYDDDPIETSTGRNYKQGLLSIMIPEGDTGTILVKKTNLVINPGEDVRLKLRSHLSYGFEVVGSILNGITIGPKQPWSGTKKINYGFVNVSIQYTDDITGYRCQADLELFIAPGDRWIDIYSKNVKNIQVIKGYNVQR